MSRKTHVPHSPSSRLAACGEPAPADGEEGVRKEGVRRAAARGRGRGTGRGGAGARGLGVRAAAAASPACGTCPCLRPSWSSLRQQPNGNIVAILRFRVYETRFYPSGRLQAVGKRRRRRRSGEIGLGERRRRTHPRPLPPTGLPGPAGPAPHLQRAADAAPRPRAGGGGDGREALPQHRACKQIQLHVTM